MAVETSPAVPKQHDTLSCLCRWLPSPWEHEHQDTLARATLQEEMTCQLDERLFMSTREHAAAITGLSLRQVDYWANTGFIVPRVNERLTPRRPIRLFDFLELMALMVAAELRRRRVSLQHIRLITARVREQGYESPLTELRWATDGNRLYFQHPDGSWEGAQRPNQVVIHQVLDLDVLRVKIRESSRRGEDILGKTERRRGRMGSKEVFAGTRVPVATVRRYLSAGRTPEEVLKSYPSLTRRDLDAIARSASA